MPGHIVERLDVVIAADLTNGSKSVPATAAGAFMASLAFPAYNDGFRLEPCAYHGSIEAGIADAGARLRGLRADLPEDMPPGKPALLLFADPSRAGEQEQTAAAVALEILRGEFTDLHCFLLFVGPGSFVATRAAVPWFAALWDKISGVDDVTADVLLMTGRQWLFRPVVPVPRLDVVPFVSGGGACVALIVNPDEVTRDLFAAIQEPQEPDDADSLDAVERFQA